jgi:hypothetical protein
MTRFAITGSGEVGGIVARDPRAASGGGATADGAPARRGEAP